jgi:recombinational DNA repair protein (RecF pathway)
LETSLLLLDATEDDPGPAFRLVLEAKALTFAGLAPVLDRCVGCSDPLDASMVFAPGAGGLFHRRCVAADGGARPVDAAFTLAVEAGRRAPLREALDADLPPGPRALLYEAVAAHLGRPLASWAVLDTLQPDPA